MANTGCAGSAMVVAPICLNFGITAPVLSCVMTWRGRIETKSPARTTVPGASPSACRAAIFSTSVRPIAIFFLDKARAVHVNFLLNKVESTRRIQRLFLDTVTFEGSARCAHEVLEPRGGPLRNQADDSSRRSRRMIFRSRSFAGSGNNVLALMWEKARTAKRQLAVVIAGDACRQHRDDREI